MIPGLALGAFIVSAPVVWSFHAPATLVAEIAPTGRLRAGINYNNPVRYVRQLIEEMKASGFVATSLARHGLGPDDAVVAPAASPE